ncbi:hypothetical protein FNW02_20760 [Komarekiella sp. 'clone 1']|uniref:Uncharacterized protein n=1 Tax=Komarekiella delphini-convector SJRDD-AB1 TaxID=2593771 RepID=A0AA40T055_9NOST|nr:hypothetical protein [Komarekiella delphini-convector]MBD6618187.1 hypothetical protein [Komarekiella delphini-convector SJRDD-AB1]
MGKNSKIAVAAILTLAIAGCASEDTQQAINPTPIPQTAAKSQPAIQSFKNPVVPAKQVSQVASATLNLIQPTNATERVVVVSKGRTDPFAQIAGQTLSAMPYNTAARPVPVLPRLPTASIVGRKLPVSSTALNQQKNKISSTQIAKRPSTRLTSVLPKVLPQVISNPTLVSVLPPPAQPELAKAVLVTGVVLIGREPQAIIKVPNEPTSRYVQAGQRLANGVLIKRIEMNEGYNPVVILEQYGIEVAKMVGESPAKSTSSAASATNNSVSMAMPL